MSTAHQHRPRYSVDDYLLWQGDWELWDGNAIAMSPSPFGGHQQVLFDLAALLKAGLRAVECDAKVLGELDWIVNSFTVVRPDVIVVCGDSPEKHLRQPPGLIAEILSPATRQNDLTFKRDLYESQAVGTYLIIDPADKTVVHLELADGKYRENPAVNGRLSLKPCEDCTISIPRADIFDR